MGRPSDQRRSAQRLGRRERARVKNQWQCRAQAWSHVGGAGMFHVKAGRKKFGKVMAHCDRVVEAHRSGDSPTSKSGGEIKRPLYKIELRPLCSANVAHEPLP